MKSLKTFKYPARSSLRAILTHSWWRRDLLHLDRRRGDGDQARTAGWTYYTWDVDESLKTIQTPTVTLESKYNSRMQRVWRSENGTAEKLIYDAQKLIAEATSTGTALNRYYLSEGGSVYSPLLADWGSSNRCLGNRPYCSQEGKR